MKLVYKGKVLEDEASSVKDQNVSEAGFVVVFIQKREAKPIVAAAVCPLVYSEEHDHILRSLPDTLCNWPLFSPL
jgi:hypothetical protein